MQKSLTSEGRAALNGSSKVFDLVRASTGENFADVIHQCPPGSLEALMEKHPAAGRLLEGKFASFVMHPRVAPGDVRAMDSHPVIGQVVGRVVQGPRRLTPVGQRTLALLRAAAQKREESRVNVYPFIPPPANLIEKPDPYHDIR